MTSFPFLVPGDIEQLSGGYGYARAVIAASKAGEGLPFERIGLPGDFPFPSSSTLEETAAVVEALPADVPVLIDGLAYGAFDEATIRRCKAPIVVLLHHPLGLETGLTEEQSRDLITREGRALEHAHHVVVTSHETARTVQSLFGLAGDRVTVALPGTPARKRASRRGRPPLIACVGSLTPRKGHLDLVAALAQIADLDWRARFAGALTASPETAAAVREAIVRARLADRIEIAGGLTGAALDDVYEGASLFALASHYEGYGMVFAEALSSGLPIVGYRAGAVPDVVPADAGFLCPTGDVDALAMALRRLLEDESLAAACAEAAFAAGQALPDWTETTGIIQAAMEKARP
jgi:glycosyltransferase involved in cell wall biosynthesis